MSGNFYVFLLHKVQLVVLKIDILEIDIYYENKLQYAHPIAYRFNKHILINKTY